MVYVGEFCANLVVYRFCEVLSYKKWTLISQYIFLEIIRQPSIISKIDSKKSHFYTQNLVTILQQS